MNDRKHGICIIFITDFIFAFVSAAHAPMYDDIRGTRAFDPDRFHHTEAHRATIAAPSRVIDHVDPLFDLKETAVVATAAVAAHAVPAKADTVGDPLSDEELRKLIAELD